LTVLEFERRTNLPHCLGTVCGYILEKNKPKQSGSLFYNYKDFCRCINRRRRHWQPLCVRWHWYIRKRLRFYHF